MIFFSILDFFFFFQNVSFKIRLKKNSCKKYKTKKYTPLKKTLLNGVELWSKNATSKETVRNGHFFFRDHNDKQKTRTKIHKSSYKKVPKYLTLFYIFLLTSHFEWLSCLGMWKVTFLIIFIVKKKLS